MFDTITHLNSQNDLISTKTFSIKRNELVDSLFLLSTCYLREKHMFKAAKIVQMLTAWHLYASVVNNIEVQTKMR